MKGGSIYKVFDKKLNKMCYNFIFIAIKYEYSINLLIIYFKNLNFINKNRSNTFFFSKSHISLNLQHNVRSFFR